MSDTFLKHFKGKAQKIDKTGLPKIVSEVGKPIKTVILPKANQSYHHMPNGTVHNIQRNYLDFTNTYRDILTSNQNKNEVKQNTSYKLARDKVIQNNSLATAHGKTKFNTLNKFKSKVKMKVS